MADVSQKHLDILAKADRIALESKFLRFVQKTDTCWFWRGECIPKGYGRLYYNGRKLRAHRVAFFLYVGVPPAGFDLDHLCKVRHCVNPSHLELVTRRENLLRGDSPVGLNARKSLCPEGHLYRYTKRGHRFCRVCMTLQQRAKRAVSRAQGIEPDYGNHNQTQRRRARLEKLKNA